ncbi:MAG: glycerophosphodiester phosphodiesterase family protein [Burkholderiales bacterium]|nr:glycerophosphodiester phosphodiesterase family protein [Burkholderiales bacterium]
MHKLLLILGLSSGFAFAASNNPYNQAGIPHNQAKQKYVEVYAHRGARSFSPENTMPGYKTALALGTDWVDMDIGISRDGVIIIDHDIWLNPDILRKDGKFFANSKSEMYSNLAKESGGIDKNIQPYLVKNLTIKQLQEYDAGRLNLNSPYAKYFPEQQAVDGTKMPTLQEVINYVNKTSNKKINFQIEIKNDPLNPTWTVSPKEFAQKINDILVKNKLVDRAEIQSFDWEPLYELHKINPKVKLAFLVGYDDIPRMQESDVKQAGLWSGGKLLKNYNYSIPQMVKALGGSLYEPEDVSLTKEDLDEAHALGLKVVVWTWPEHSGNAFNPEVVNRLIDWGVDGIITDDPARLNSILASRGMRVPQNYPDAASK